MLDLACGKGAVSVNLAKQIGCVVKGIDIISGFLGAVGDVSGNLEDTITLLKNTIKRDGYIIIDDANRLRVLPIQE